MLTEIGKIILQIEKRCWVFPISCVVYHTSRNYCNTWNLISVWITEIKIISRIFFLRIWYLVWWYLENNFPGWIRGENIHAKFYFTTIGDLWRSILEKIHQPKNSPKCCLMSGWEWITKILPSSIWQKSMIPIFGCGSAHMRTRLLWKQSWRNSTSLEKGKEKERRKGKKRGKRKRVRKNEKRKEEKERSKEKEE